MKLRLDENGHNSITLTNHPVLVGSHPRSEIKSDKSKMHRRHALIAHLLAGWAIFDLRSRHGIFVNGEKVTRSVLHSGDRVEVGPLRMHVEGEGDEDQPAEGAEEDHSWLDQVLSESDSGRSFSSRSRLDFYLDEKLHRSVIADGDMIIGTSVRAQIRLPRRGISSLHCLLTLDGSSWNLYDLRSDAGIVFKGEPTDWLSLHDGDEFRLGDFRVVFRLQPDQTELQDDEDLVDETFGSVSTPSSGVLTDASFDAQISSGALSTSGLAFSELEGATPALDSKVAQAVTMLRDRDYEPAIRILREVCADAPFALRYRKQLRQAQIALVDSQGEDLSLAQRWTLWKLQRLGARYWRKGEPLKTLLYAEEGLTLDPWNRDLLVLEALVFEQQQMLHHCIWVLSTARLKAPEDVKLNRVLAKIMQHLGEYDRAERFWKLVQKVEPDNHEAERQIRAVLVQKTLQHNRYQGSDSWENLLEE